MKRSRTALLAKPKDDENEAEAPDPDDAAEASAAGGDAAPISAAGNGGCFEDASETPGKPLEVTEKEGGRIPLMQTDHVSTPNRGALEYDNDYQGAGYDASARDIEALLNRMAEERLEVKRTSRLNELAQNISYGDIHEGIKITVHRMTSVSDTLRDRYPQAFGAVVHRAQEMTSISRTFVIDIGGYTSDVLLLRKGKPDMEFCRSLNMGVITMTNHIAGKVNSLYDISIDDEHICEILAGQNTVLDGEIQKAIRGEVEKYAADMLNKLRELQVDLRTNPAIFVGGGSILLRAFIKASAFVSAVEFEPDTRANAYGYELLGQAQLEKLARRAGSAI